MSLNLWKEILSPEPITNLEIPNLSETNLAWDWLYLKDTNGLYIHAEIAQKVIWQHSYEIHKQTKNQYSGLIALWGIYRRYGVVISGELK